MKIYLDNCSFNRPFDDQTHITVHLETEAKLYIQAKIKEKKFSLCWSYMLDYENAENPYEDKRNSISPWKALADDFCGSSDDILQSGKDIMKNGIRAKDALHIACAIYKSCQYFITTDKKLINKKIDGIKLINPIDFILEVEEADEN